MGASSRSSTKVASCSSSSVIRRASGNTSRLMARSVAVVLALAVMAALASAAVAAPWSRDVCPAIRGMSELVGKPAFSRANSRWRLPDPGHRRTARKHRLTAPPPARAHCRCSRCGEIDAPHPRRTRRLREHDGAGLPRLPLMAEIRAMRRDVEFLSQSGLLRHEVGIQLLGALCRQHDSKDACGQREHGEQRPSGAAHPLPRSSRDRRGPREACRRFQARRAPRPPSCPRAARHG